MVLQSAVPRTVMELVDWVNSNDVERVTAEGEFDIVFASDGFDTA